MLPTLKSKHIIDVAPVTSSLAAPSSLATPSSSPLMGPLTMSRSSTLLSQVFSTTSERSYNSDRTLVSEIDITEQVPSTSATAAALLAAALAQLIPFSWEEEDRIYTKPERDLGVSLGNALSTHSLGLY